MTEANAMNAMLKTILEYDGFNRTDFHDWFIEQFNNDHGNTIGLVEFSIQFVNNLHTYAGVHLQVGNTDEEKKNDAEGDGGVDGMLGEAEAGAWAGALARMGLVGMGAETNSQTPMAASEFQKGNKTSWKTDDINADDLKNTPEINMEILQDLLSHGKRPTTTIKLQCFIDADSAAAAATATANNSNPSKASNANFAKKEGGNQRYQYQQHNKQHSQQQQQQQQQQSQKKRGKPKKRLMPTSVVRKSDLKNQTFNIFDGQSSFSNVQNLVNLSPNEVDCEDDCAIRAARKSLQNNTNAIKDEFKNTFESFLQSDNNKEMAARMKLKPTRSVVAKLFKLDAFGVEIYQELLEKLCNIYNVLINFNLVANVLNEISFLLNILSCVETNAMIKIWEAEKKSGKAASMNDNKNDHNDNADNADNNGGGGGGGDGDNNKNDNNILKCLEITTNATYFAILMLEKQVHILGLLDGETLNVICSSKIFNYMPFYLQRRLQESLASKQKGRILAENVRQQTLTVYNTARVAGGVYFQEDINSRCNFGTQREFASFRMQRDLFYSVWNIWQIHHLNPNWNFIRTLTPKIHQIFQQSEDLINMIHFTKLFVSQLLTASRNLITPMEDVALLSDIIDLDKLLKLEKRFTSPSKFSVKHQFPDNLNFFREFIIASRSVVFIEQLKIELYDELMKLNASDLEQVNIGRIDVIEMVDDDKFAIPLIHNNGNLHDGNDADEGCENGGVCGVGGGGGGAAAAAAAAAANDKKYYIVRREIVSDLIVLAKFFGFTITLPFTIIKPDDYQQSLAIFDKLPVHLANRQMQLRNSMPFNYDLYTILYRSICDGKLLIVIPWLVQFFAMLDDVTIQLDDNIKVLRMMFIIYIKLINKHPCCTYNGMNVFVIRLCIGWLIAQKNIAIQQYYNFCSQYYRNMNDDVLLSEEDDDVRVIVNHLNAYAAHVANSSATSLKLDGFLESILLQACPFLADFRISIMSVNNYDEQYIQQQMSRHNGKFHRRITTYILDLPSRNIDDMTFEDIALTSPKIRIDPEQKMLRGYFLNTQSIEIRQLIRYCIERCCKSLVKDSELKILAPAKLAADKMANEIDFYDTKIVYKKLQEIYTDAHRCALVDMRKLIMNSVCHRVQLALEGLLPQTITPMLSKCYAVIIEQEVVEKMNKWLASNANIKKSIFNVNIKELTTKLCTMNASAVRFDAIAASNEIQIGNLKFGIAEFMRELQFTIHCASARPDLYAGIRVVTIMSADADAKVDVDADANADVDAGGGGGGAGAGGVNSTPVAIVNLLKKLPQIYQDNILPYSFFHLIATNITYLMQNIIANHPNDLTEELIGIACDIWVHPKGNNAIKALENRGRSTTPPLPPPLGILHQLSKQKFNYKGSDATSCTVGVGTGNIHKIYDGLLSVSFILSLGDNRLCFEKLSKLLIMMAKRNVISIDFIYNQFIELLKYEWELQTLAAISRMLRHVAVVINKWSKIYKNAYLNFDCDLNDAASKVADEDADIDADTDTDTDTDTYADADIGADTDGEVDADAEAKAKRYRDDLKDIKKTTKYIDILVNSSLR